MDYCHKCGAQILVYADQPHKWRDTVWGQRDRWCNAVCYFEDKAKNVYVPFK